jgi:periplasmic protein TonB
LYRLLASLAVMPLLIVVVFEIGRRSSAYVSAESESSMESRLGLKLERTGRDWRLSWNPDARIILQAKKGHLLITDGASRKSLDLDSSDLRGGTLMYAPLTSDVVFRLEVHKGDSAATVSESVRIAGSLIAPPGTQVLSPASGDHRTDSRWVIDDAGAQPDVLTPVADRLLPVKVPRSLQTGPSRILSNVGPPETKATPPVKLEEADLSHSTPTPPVQSAQASRLDPVLSELFSAESPARDLVRPTDNFEPAQLIVRSEPVYPPAAKQLNFSGAVELHFRITAEGTVYAITVVKGNALLAKAAVDAVQMWRYKPARLNGASVGTVGTAVLDFK